MPTEPSHILFDQRIARKRKILKNKAFINAFGKHNTLTPKKKPSSPGSIESQSSLYNLNSPGLQSSGSRKTPHSQRSKDLIKIVTDERLPPNLKALIQKKY
jgi:hypothetical protein